jgi:hypothetical protein
MILCQQLRNIWYIGYKAGQKKPAEEKKALGTQFAMGASGSLDILATQNSNACFMVPRVVGMTA